MRIAGIHGKYTFEVVEKVDATGFEKAPPFSCAF
jgi:hypothetical protein